MKKAIKIGLSVIAISLSILGVAQGAQNHTDNLKADSEDYDFTVLELVPSEREATFGYSIGGQEPIDISKYQNDVDMIDKILGETNLLKSVGHRDIPVYTWNELTDAQIALLSPNHVKFNQAGFYKRGENGITRYSPLYAPSNDTMSVRYDKYLDAYVEAIICGGENHTDADSDNVCDVCFRNLADDADYSEADDVPYLVYEKTTNGYVTVNRTSDTEEFDFTDEKYIFIKKSIIDDAMIAPEDSIIKECKYIIDFTEDENGEWSFYPAHKARRYAYENGVFTSTPANVPSEFYTQYYFASNSKVDTGAEYAYKSTQLAVESSSQDEYVDLFELANTNAFESTVTPNKNVEVIVKRYDKVTAADVNKANLIVVNTGGHSEVLSELYDAENPQADKTRHDISEIPATIVTAIQNKLASQNCTILFDDALDTQSTDAMCKLYSAVNITYPNIAKQMNLIGKGNVVAMRNFISGLTDNYHADYTLFGIDNYDLNYDIVAKHNVLSFKNAKFNVLTEFNTRQVYDTEMTNDVFMYANFIKDGIDNTRDDEFIKLILNIEDIYNTVSDFIEHEYTTPAFCLNYLLNKQKTTPIVDLPTLKVLEIEPCNKFFNDEYWNYRAFGIDPYYTGNIKVTRMSSKQFIGDITNLYDSYDVVYFGAIYEDLNYESQNTTSTGLINLNKNTSIPYTTFGVTGNVTPTLAYSTYYAFADGTCSPNDISGKHVAKMTMTANNNNLYVECEGTYGLFTNVPVTLSGKVYYLNAVYTANEQTGLVESFAYMMPYGATNDYTISAEQFGFATAENFEFDITMDEQESSDNEFEITRNNDVLHVVAPADDNEEITSYGGDIIGRAKYGSNVSVSDLSDLIATPDKPDCKYVFEYFITENDEALEKKETITFVEGYVESTDFDIYSAYVSDKSYDVSSTRYEDAIDISNMSHTYGYYNNNGSTNNAMRGHIRFSSLISVEPNTTYKFKLNDSTNAWSAHIVEFNASNRVTGITYSNVKNDTIITTSASATQIGIDFSNGGNDFYIISSIRNRAIAGISPIKFQVELPAEVSMVDKNGCLAVTKQLLLANDQYTITIGDNYSVNIYEFGDDDTYIKNSTFRNGNIFTPDVNTKSIGIVLVDRTNADKTAEEWMQDIANGLVGFKMTPVSSSPKTPPYDTTSCTWYVPDGVNTIEYKGTTAIDGYMFKENNTSEDVKYVVINASTNDVVGYVTGISVEVQKDLNFLAYPNIYASSVNDIVTVFNDRAMNGLLYFHTGDTVQLSTSNNINISGSTWLSNERSTQRFSGNDITKRDYSELIDFANKGKLIMFAGTFFDDDGEIKSSKIDSMSWIYKLTQNDDIDVYDETELTNFDFNRLADTEFELNVTSAPLTYRDVTRATWGSDSVSFSGYDNAKDLGKTVYSYDELDMTDRETAFYIKDRNITIDFNISQLVNGDNTYYVQLFADSISDGKFTSDEEITSVAIENENGDRVRYNRLKANENYKLSFSVADELNGIIHWQLRLYRVGEDSNYKQVESYFALYRNAEDATSLNVLQILPSSGETFNLATHAKFNTYLRAIKEYDVVIFQARESNLLKANGTDLKDEIFTKEQCDQRYAEVSANIGKTITYDDAHGLKFSDFDMIVLGYADYKTYLTKESTLNAMSDFISSGKAVLMTHDNIDFMGSMSAGSNEERKHIYVNKYFRTTFGQDRFGINARPTAPVYSSLGTTNDKTYWITHDYDIDSFTQTVTSLGFDYSSAHGEYSSDGIAGFTDTFLVRIAKENQSQYYPYNKDTVYNNKLSNGTNNGEVKKAKCLNEGQISNYPYRIDDIISIAPTHCSYYQLNMENDNITAWYCLYEPSKNNESGSVSTQKNTIFASPNDAVNNFYIYTNKNLTYTGVGHKANITDDELKLFVNTLVLSYRAAAVTPEIEVLNENADVYDKNVDIYLDYNVTEPTKLLDNSLVDNKFRIEFTTTQAFAGTNINNYIQFVDSSNNVLPFTIYSKNTGQPMAMFTNVDGNVYYTLDESDSWYFDIPIDDINNKYGFDFDDVYQYMFKFNLLTTYGVENLDITDSYEVHIIKRSLFNMH